jgi:peroxiredoxin
VAAVTLAGSCPPEFALPDLLGVTRRLSDLRGRIGVLVFWSCECSHAERLDRALTQLAPGWPDEVAVWRIASAAHETPQQLMRQAQGLGLAPVLLDSKQELADSLAAEVTPHVVVLDRQGIIRYVGAPDDVTLRQRQPTRSYLAEAVTALLSGAAPDPSEVPAFGCVLTRA